MKIGDQVHYIGTVRDIVGGSALTQHDDGREYWFQIQHLKVTATTEEPPAPELPVAQLEDPEVEQAIAKVMTHGYTREAAKAIVRQVGTTVILHEKESASEAPQSAGTEKPGLPSAADLDAVEKENQLAQSNTAAPPATEG
jgi:hypothetical protein